MPSIKGVSIEKSQFTTGRCLRADGQAPQFAARDHSGTDQLERRRREVGTVSVSDTESGRCAARNCADSWDLPEGVHRGCTYTRPAIVRRRRL